MTAHARRNGRRLWRRAALFVLPLALLTAGARADPATPATANHATTQWALDGSGNLPQVTIEAHRQSMQARVRAFIADATVLKNDESLARWNRPICPMVVGLPRADGEYLLTRISAVARAVGAPLASPACKNHNLIIIVAADPVAVLKSWAARVHYRNLFGDAGMSTVNHFVTTSRPIRVWYNDARAGANGAIERQGGAPTPGILGNGAPVISHAEPSRVVRTEIWGITSVIELVDSRQLRGFKVGQLADFVSVAGLAQFNPDANLGTAPTILNLFKAPAGAAPADLASWDEPFLKGLYHTDQSSVLQTERIKLSMVGELGPVNTIATLQ